MKNLRSLFILVPIIIMGLSSCSNGGPLTTEVRTVPAFTGVDAGDGVKIVVTYGAVQEVSVEAPENFMPYITTTVSGNKLVIERDQLFTGFSDKITIHITTNNLVYIKLSGASQLTSSDAFSAGFINANLSGGARLTFNVAVNNLYIEASGGSSATISGTANNVNLNGISGGSSFKGFGLSANNLTLLASGGSNLEVKVNNQLNVTASGGSIIKYKGTPGINSNLSGGSQLVNSN